MNPARLIAFEVLEAVRQSDAYANLLLPARLDQARLSRSDAGLATELTYGTLRMSGFYDRVITVAASRDADDIDAPLLDVLRLGAHQLLALRTPPHAAVNETVAMAGLLLRGNTTGFVNAVMRRIAENEPEWWRARVIEGITDEDARRAAATSHPAWIVRTFRQALAVEGVTGEALSEELDALLEADNEPPRVNLVALPGLAEVPEEAAPNVYSPYGFSFAPAVPEPAAEGTDRADDSRSPKELGSSDEEVPAPEGEPAPAHAQQPRIDPIALLRSSDGTIRVQDEGSQLAALALVAATPVVEGERWLDLCAGPGGKAALMGALAAPAGAHVLANEVVPSRAELVRRAVAPVADTVEVVEGDGRRQHGGSFDRVLVDAPCTGLGALRRRPEARWRKTPSDLASLMALQRELLDAAVAALKPGGVLAYVTCSPHLGETRGQIADLLKRHPSLEQLPTAELLQEATRTPVPCRGDQAVVQLWPHRHGTDAMFIALLRRP